jgi:hypothetical protein
MAMTVFMDEAGVVWVVSAEGDFRRECFFKAEDETEEELRDMGYQHLFTAYPAVHIAVGTGIELADLGELFLEV